MIRYNANISNYIILYTLLLDKMFKHIIYGVYTFIVWRCVYMQIYFNILI